MLAKRLMKFTEHSLFMMQEVVSQVVADVPKDPPTEDSDGSVPVVEEDGMGELVEGTRKGDEKRRWHY